LVTSRQFRPDQKANLRHGADPSTSGFSLSVTRILPTGTRRIHAHLGFLAKSADAYPRGGNAMKRLQNAASPFEATSAPGPARAGYVMEWVIDPEHYCSAHERITRRALAERIAAL